MDEGSASCPARPREDLSEEARLRPRRAAAVAPADLALGVDDPAATPSLAESAAAVLGRGLAILLALPLLGIPDTLLLPGVVVLDGRAESLVPDVALGAAPEPRPIGPRYELGALVLRADERRASAAPLATDEGAAMLCRGSLLAPEPAMDPDEELLAIPVPVAMLARGRLSELAGVVDVDVDVVPLLTSLGMMRLVGLARDLGGRAGAGKADFLGLAPKRGVSVGEAA